MITPALSTKMGPGLLLFVALVGACVAEEPLGENNWALLVASTGVQDSWFGSCWINYCIQSSVCHAYHSILATGIPAGRIIVMMPDDVANDPRNTYPGKIFDRPNGKDVYAGVKIDYRGKDVTPENFLNVLSGNKTAMAGKGNGRVIESDENTNLFVYLSDHGCYQLVGFGDDELYANQLLDTISAMRSQKTYNKLFFYLESCVSGSMFEGMYPADFNVFAMTAANSSQDASMCNCGDEINGACMAIEFSAGWAGLLDSQPEGTHLSFEQIFHYTNKYVLISNVSQYGNLKLGSDEIIANSVGVTPTPADSHCSQNYSSNVPINEGNLHYLKWQVSHAKDADSLKKSQSNLDKYIQEEEKIAELKSKLLELFASENRDIESFHFNGVVLPSNPKSRICYQDVVTHFKEHCVHPMRFCGALTIFANACVIELDMTKLKREMISICEPYKALIS